MSDYDTCSNFCHVPQMQLYVLVAKDHDWDSIDVSGYLLLPSLGRTKENIVPTLLALKERARQYVTEHALPAWEPETVVTDGEHALSNAFR